MGPPPFGDGNAPGSLPEIVGTADVPASMGPPPFGDGNIGPRHLDATGDARSGFNGATAFRRWKQVGSPVVQQCGYRGFNGATAFRRWKPTPRRAGCPRGRGFNGATAFRRWKQPKPDAAAIVRPVASMGPSPFGDGNRGLRGRRNRRTPGFNGATAFRRWKPTEPSQALPLLAPLQWGHRLSAMETVGFRRRPQRGRNASMGPPPFGDGNSNTMCRHPHSPCSFNGPPPFGDGNVASRETLIVTTLLQWGHRLSAMETPPVLPETFKHGATAFRRWKQFNQRQSASMGPPPFGDGNNSEVLGLFDAGDGATAFMLQWGHPRRCRFNGATAYSAMETRRH